MTSSLVTSTSWQVISYRERIAARTPSVKYSGAEAPADNPVSYTHLTLPTIYSV